MTQNKELKPVKNTLENTLLNMLCERSPMGSMEINRKLKEIPEYQSIPKLRFITRKTLDALEKQGKITKFRDNLTLFSGHTVEERYWHITEQIRLSIVDPDSPYNWKPHYAKQFDLIPMPADQIKISDRILGERQGHSRRDLKTVARYIKLHCHDSRISLAASNSSLKTYIALHIDRFTPEDSKSKKIHSNTPIKRVKV